MVSLPLPGDLEGRSIYAATVAPNGDAITLELSVLRRLTLEDIALAGVIADMIIYKPMNNPLRQPRDVHKPDTPEIPDDGD